MAFGIMRINKLKTTKNVDGVIKHNHREKPVLNSNGSGVIHEIHGNVESVVNRIALATRKQKKDGVMAYEILFAYSPEWNPSDEKKKEWSRKNTEWLIETFGRENVIDKTGHPDEGTYHEHSVVVPLTTDGRMCAKEWTGSPKKMRALQDSYAEKVGGLGLERGVKYSKAKHQDIRRFYGLINSESEVKPISLVKNVAGKMEVLLSGEMYKMITAKLKAFKNLQTELKRLRRQNQVLNFEVSGKDSYEPAVILEKVERELGRLFLLRMEIEDKKKIREIDAKAKGIRDMLTKLVGNQFEKIIP